MRSQLERILSLLYRRERRCLEIIEKVAKSKSGTARISPREAAEEIFKHEVPEVQLLCFLLLVSRANHLALDVIQDLGKRGDGAVSVDEALLILHDELDAQCRFTTAQTIKLIEGAKKGKVIKIKEIT